MAKAQSFSVFAGATPPVAPAATEPPQAAPEPPQEPPAAEEPRKAAKPRQRPAQPRAAATQPDADPVALSRAELDRWNHWLNAAAGKLGRTLTGPTGAQASAQAWQSVVADARKAGVGDFPVVAAGMRAYQGVPEAVAAIVAALADVPELQRAVVQAAVQAAGYEPGSEDEWLHT